MLEEWNSGVVLEWWSSGVMEEWNSGSMAKEEGMRLLSWKMGFLSRGPAYRTGRLLRNDTGEEGMEYWSDGIMGI